MAPASSRRFQSWQHRRGIHRPPNSFTPRRRTSSPAIPSVWLKPRTVPFGRQTRPPRRPPSCETGAAGAGVRASGVGCGLDWPVQQSVSARGVAPEARGIPAGRLVEPQQGLATFPAVARSSLAEPTWSRRCPPGAEGDLGDNRCLAFPPPITRPCASHPRHGRGWAVILQ